MNVDILVYPVMLVLEDTKPPHFTGTQVPRAVVALTRIWTGCPLPFGRPSSVIPWCDALVVCG